MKTPQNYKSEIEKLTDIIDNRSAPMQDRIISLCRLYQWYQGDIYNQAKTVRRIEDIVRGVE